MNALSRREEEALIKNTKQQAIKQCDDLLREFIDCSRYRTISMLWACRPHLKALQNCMYQYTGPEAMERARKEYIRAREASAAEKATSFS